MKCYRCNSWPCDCRDGVTLIHGDCRTALAGTSLYFDMALADPPYGETSLEWDRWPTGWLDCVANRLMGSASLWCFGSMRMFLQQQSEFSLYRFVQDVVWEKHNGSGFLTDRFRRVHETAAHFVLADCKWSDVYKSPQFTNDATARVVRKKEKPAHWHGATGSTTYVSIDGGPRMMRSVQRVRSCHGRANHPTEKPEGILEPLIEYSCPPGGFIYVPFAGCGSELAVAKKLGRRAVGVEIDESYCERSATRLEQGVLEFGGAA